MLRLVIATIIAVLALAQTALGACPDSTPSYTSPCGPTFTLPQWSDMGGWSDPGAYDTIQLANVDGVAGDELIGRDGNGLWVERWNAERGQWATVGSADGGPPALLLDALGWGQPSAYKTIQTANIDGDGRAALLARDGAGIHTYRFDTAAQRFVELGTAHALSDAGHWNRPEYYETIQTADVDGDGRAELLARGAGGLHVLRWDSADSRWVEIAVIGAFSNADGFADPVSYRTITSADIDGDGTEEILGRGPEGMITFRWNASSGAFEELGTPSQLPDKGGWNRPEYYETIQTADIDGDGRAELLARGSAGLHTLRWDASEARWIDIGVLHALADGSGGRSPSVYRTIRAGDVDGDGRAELVARLDSGVSVYSWSGATPAEWVRRDATPLALTGDTWTVPEHYETLRLAPVDGSGRAMLMAKGPFGIRTFAWDDATRTFTRPRSYGAFPAFTGDQAAAYTAVGRFLLERNADFRLATYATPSEEITEATLDRYRGRLEQRCTPAGTMASGALAGAPRYTDCTPPPGSGVSSVAWTAVSNQIIDELWAAAGATAYFSSLASIQLALFQDKNGTLPALDAALKLPPNVPDTVPQFLKLIKSGLEILGDTLQLIPQAKLVAFLKTAVGGALIRSIAFAANTIGAAGEGLGLATKPPSPPQAWARVTEEVARLQQSERDITEAQRRYVLADYGLLMTVGSLANSRILTLDRTAALSAGRQAFAKWAYQQLTPAYWERLEVSNCQYNVPAGIYCTPPSGPNVRTVGQHHFVAIVPNASTCIGYIFVVACSIADPGEVGTRIWGAVDDDCRYDPTPGSTAAWRYGCNLGIPGADLLDGRDGWSFPTWSCSLPRHMKPAGTVCNWATAALSAGAVHDPAAGPARVSLRGSVTAMGMSDLRLGRSTATLEDILFDEDDAAELLQLGSHVAMAPVALVRREARAGRASFVSRRRSPVGISVRAVRRGSRLTVAVTARGGTVAVPHVCAEGRRSVRMESRVRLAARRGSRRHRDVVLRGAFACPKPRSSGLAMALRPRLRR